MHIKYFSTNGENNMSKYNFTLNMNGKNSNSIILKNIKPNSKVLEVGCAYGRMTKYLKENLNCYVTISEIDTESGSIASKYADKSYIGEGGNVEIPNFFDDILNQDYIVFADVLEHTLYPEKVLTNCKKSLSQDGIVHI